MQTRLLTGVLFAGLVTTGCGSSLRPTQAPASAKSSAGSVQPGTQTYTAETMRELEAVCGGRKPCSLERRYEAGLGTHGEHLAVLKVGLGTHERSKPMDGSRCNQFEFWLVEHHEDGLQDARHMLDVCNDVKRDDDPVDVSVGPNALEYSSVRGNNWMVSEGAILQLSPMRVLSTNQHGWSSRGPEHSVVVREDNGLHEHVSWFAPSCDQTVRKPEGRLNAKTAGNTASNSNGMPFEYDSIPSFEFPRTFTQTGWEDSSIGACALTIGGGEEHGWMAYGTDERPSATLSVVASNHGEMFLEVHPGPFSGRTVSVELWTSDHLPDPSSGCLVDNASTAALSGWAIDPSTAEVSRIHGTRRETVHVQRTGDESTPGHATRLKVTLDSVPNALSLVLIEHEGKIRARSVATSRFVSESVASLGARNSGVHGHCDSTTANLQFVASDSTGLSALPSQSIAFATH